MKERNVIAVSKDKGLITISLDDNTSIKIDCINHKIKSFSGRNVINFPKGIIFNDDVKQYKILAQLDELCRDVFVQQLCSTIETLWNYLDILEDIPHKQIPKGYAKYCRDNNIPINNGTLAEYEAYQKVKNVKEQDKELYKNILLKISKRHNVNLNDVAIFAKIYRATLKTNNFEATLCIGSDLYNFIEEYYSYINNVNTDINNIIDTNRDFQTNIQLLREARNKIKERKIIEQEDKIRDLTNLDLGDYIIIVPETLTDFTKEGQMQNNCVGHYYHDSIAAGLNLIYFIRKKTSPDKSYITCRYHIINKTTVEHRTKNNVYYEYDEMLKKCDERIKELLSA